MDTKRNPVSALHEYAQKHGLQLEFVGVGDEGPAHMKVFTQRAILNGKPYPSGQGKNKKEARAVAAQNALECLRKEQNQNQVGDSPSQQQQTLNKNVADICAKTQSLNLNSKDNSSVKTNFIGIINHYCQKTNSSPNYIEVGRSGPPHNLTFFYKLKIGTKEYPVAEGKTRTEAKQNAAKLAWLALQEQSDFNSKISVRSTASEDGEASLSSQSDALDSTPSSSQNMETNSSNSKIVAKPSNSSNPQGGDSRVQQNEMLSINLTGGSALTQSLSFTSKVNSSTETNFVGLINQHCQRRNIFPNYIEERSGSAHNPQFSCRLKIGTVEYPVAEGKSSKEARQNAAKLAWLMLQKQLDYDCKVSVGSTSGDGRSSSSQSDALDPTESSLQNMETSSSSSIIFADSLNISNSQLPRRTGSGEKAPSPIESSEPSESEATGSSDLDSSRASAEQNDVDNKKIVNTTKPPVQSRFTSEFEIIKCLGKGGFGCVFKVKENLLGMDYAVKIVDGTEKALREVMVLAEIQHENIVRYYNCWIEDSDVQQERIQKKIKEFKCGKCLFIKMELCEFETLRHWINAKNKEEMQPWQRGAESLLIAQQIVNGVECIHSNNHIHRDLKPSNIMFGKNGKVKIGDFGLVTVDISEISVDRTQGPGTKSYMAPEQTGRRYDRKVDMFALGLIFFELLWKISTGHERSVIWEEARNQNFPPEFSQAFPFECQIIKYLLSEKPEDRPEASELKAKLEELNQQHRDQHSV